MTTSLAWNIDASYRREFAHIASIYRHRKRAEASITKPVTPRLDG
jgi:hypothetical protein